MRNILISLLLFSTSFFTFSQYETVKVDLKYSSLTLRKCKGILFNHYIGNTFSYPSNEKTSKIDRLFIHNSDTINFQILKNGKIIIEGKKLPEIEAFDTVYFYKKDRIVRKEIWVQQYFADSTGFTSSTDKNALYASSDEATWIRKIFYKKGEIKSELAKTIEREDNKACFKTLKIKSKMTKTLHCKCYDYTD